MGVGILIITHDGIGASLLETASKIYGSAPLEARTLAAPRDADPEALYREALTLRAEVDSGDGVLVLSDLYGSTPSNIAARVAADTQGRLVTGVNLPMLVRVFNYPELDLASLARKAVEGGRNGVVS